MHQARLGVHTYVGFHTKVPLITLFAGVHLGVTLFIFVLGGGGRCNECGVHRGADFQEQAALSQELIDSLQDLL